MKKFLILLALGFSALNCMDPERRPNIIPSGFGNRVVHGYVLQPGGAQHVSTRYYFSPSSSGSPRSSDSASSNSSQEAFYDPVEARRKADIAHTECENNFIGSALVVLVGLIIVQAYWHLSGV